jgi:pyridoxal phosphate enzyme (YggS family)
VPNPVESVRERIRAACERVGRDPASVRLIAVSKGHTIEEIKRIAGLGVADFGENRLQEAIPKLEAVGNVTWHFVGHVQSNKAARIAQLFDYVHSVDGENAARRMREAKVLIEVDFTDIEGRAGVAPDGTQHLAEVLKDAGTESIGLMTVAPPGDAQVAARCFANLRELRDEIRVQTGLALPELSMGMSDDFEIAIEQGATMVRIGRALFVPR